MNQKWNHVEANLIKVNQKPVTISKYVFINKHFSFFPQKINVDNAPSADSPQTSSIKDHFFSPADGENRILHLYWKPSRLFAIQQSFKHRTPLPGIWPGSENAVQCCLESDLDLGLTKQQEQLKDRTPSVRSGHPVYDNECGIATFTPC